MKCKHCEAELDESETEEDCWNNPDARKSGSHDLGVKLDILVGEIRSKEYEMYNLKETSPIADKDYYRGRSKAFQWCAEKLTEIVKAL